VKNPRQNPKRSNPMVTSRNAAFRLSGEAICLLRMKRMAPPESRVRTI
jgi:hypothetical protein